MPSTSSPAFTTTVVGIQGPPGNGAPGTTTRGGTGTPANTLGIDGDLYLDSATGKLYLRTSGAYSLFMTLVGLQGAPGTTGASTTWRAGSSAPTDSVGNDGDLYLVATSGDVYQRAAGHYTLVANIKGLTGATGTAPVWRSGATAPADGTGMDGDLFLLTTTSDVYQRASGHYAVIANIKGAAGAAGVSNLWRYGSSVPSDTVGNDGDLYLLSTTGDVYQRTSGHYAIAANIKGVAGATGTPGTILRSGSAAPVNTTGIDGDYYLVSTTGALYQRVSGAYVSAGNLQGPQGNQGNTGAKGDIGATGPQGTLYPTGETAIAYAATITPNAAIAPAGAVTLTGNATINAMTGATPGFTYVLRVKQDATGSRIVTWAASIIWPNGVKPVLSTTPGAVDIYTQYLDGAGQVYGFVGGKAFA